MDKETMERILDKKLGSLNSKMDEVTTSIEETMKTVKFISKQYDEILIKLTTIEEEKRLLLKENESLRQDLTEATQELESLRECQNKLEQYSRRDCLEIKGIPVKEGEVTSEIVVKIANKIGVKITSQDISTSHRLPRRVASKDEPAMIVKFVRRDTRDQLYKARKRLRDITTKDLGYRGSNRVFINESLTRVNKNLLSKCLKVKRDFNFKYVWTNAGRIMLRETDESPVLRISTEKDLNKFTQVFDST